MISKGRTGSSFGGLHRYLFRGRTGEAAERGLQDYLLDGRSGTEQDRVAWTSTRNVFPEGDPRMAALVMETTAEQNVRVQKPVYHVSLSAAPGERFTQAEWEAIADRLLQRLKLHEHQVLLVAHRDTAHDHVHLMVNRVHPDTLKAWDNGHDYYRRERALRHIERELKLREVPGRHYRLPGQERPARNDGVTTGERREQVRTGAEPWAERVRAGIRDEVKTAGSWAELEARLKEHGLHLRKRGRGLVITDGERMVKASRIHRGSSYAKLAERFGSTFEEWRQDRAALLRTAKQADRLERYRAELKSRERSYQSERYRAREVLDKYQDANRSARENVRNLAFHLDLAYRPGELSTVRRRLGELVRREGLQRAAHVLNDHPERLGRLKGVGVPGFGTKARENAYWSVHNASQRLWDLHEARRQRSHFRSFVRPAAAAHGRAQARLWKTMGLLRSLPRGQVEKQLARLGVKLGMKAVALVLPKELVLPVKAAVWAVELARSRGRGRGR